jgi:hypothetical protein
MDVKTMFLNMGSLRRIEVHGRESDVCRIKKDLYKLKHAHMVFHEWYSRIDRYLYFRVLDLPRERQILTCNSYLLERMWVCIYTYIFILY